MPVITNIDDLKRLHKRRAPKMFYDYAESGSWTEQTFRENGMQCADGEIKAARAAEKFGVPFTLSTMSICSIEDVAAHTSKPFWFQVYTLKDDDFMKRLFARAKDAQCSAIVITLDLQLLGQRHKDLKNGLTAPPKFTPATVANLATKWAWGLEMLQTKRRFFGNIVGHAKGVKDPSSLGNWTNESFDQALDWDRVAELRKMWDGPVILKGILDVEDAKKAANLGVDAMEQIVEAVGDKVEVHFDSGIRSGQDVLKAMALGAKGTYIGRAYIYGLGAMGEKGVTKALEVIHKELDMTMGLAGKRDINDVDRDILLVPKGFAGEWA